ncbi:MAG: tRNA (N(6)-L-threonylcarbamoyladenosine(37)-C(2))-methylthiotransferase MtaB [Lachnospira sp.]|nr:tRNA (N(6)-L-threonylcarbamoyladenosine(37)-C(2))-methylthiotransferase MtaB [Lachnospira sp.]
MKKVAIHSLGCKVNSYEAESMEIMLRDAGYEIVPFKDDVQADIYIINTCSVTNIADRKSRQMLHRAKKMNPDAVVVAAGCYVQADPEGVERDECVDIILGNNMKISIVEALEEYFADKGNSTFLVDINDRLQEYEELKINQTGEHTRAYIKIQDGCNQFCSYCIIPYVRGRVRSRKPEDIISEVKTLALTGVKEVVLTGIHISSYGTDLENVGLIQLIEMIHGVEGIHRIRLGSLEPRIITDEFAERISKLSKICPHFHLSLQSGCDKTLKAMNRKYDTEEYYEGCERLRKSFDNPAITTDVIVGFPGESEEDFRQTKNFLEKVSFYEMHIFKYSRRKGTVADKMTDQISDEVKSQRSAELLELEKQQSFDYRKGYIGTEIEVLIEELTQIDGKSYYTGYTKNYIRVAVSADYFDGINPVNELYVCLAEGLSEDGATMYARLKDR